MCKLTSSPPVTPPQKRWGKRHTRSTLMAERYLQRGDCRHLESLYRSRHDFADMLINGMKTMLNVKSDYARAVLRKCAFFFPSLSLSHSYFFPYTVLINFQLENNCPICSCDGQSQRASREVNEMFLESSSNSIISVKRRNMLIEILKKKKKKGWRTADIQNTKCMPLCQFVRPLGEALAFVSKR